MNDEPTQVRPDDDRPPEPEAVARPTELKDPVRLAKPARLSVFLSVALSVVGLVSTGMELQFVNNVEAGAYATDAALFSAADANDMRQMVVGIAQIVVFVLAAVFVGRWIYFSNRNVRLLGATGLKNTPGWAVGWYFVPIANLWKPYQAMKEIWQASANPLEWFGQERTPLLPLWWLFWLVSNVIGQVSFRMAREAETIADFQRMSYVTFVSEGVNLALCGVFILLLNQIVRLQLDAMQHKSTLAVFGP